MALPPELVLVAAIVRRLVSDVTSPNGAIRDEARLFLRRPHNCAFWDDLVGVPVLATLARTVLGEEGDAC
jgi:hypothetical protein